MSKIVEFDVAMTCNGCATAVNRILSKIQGLLYGHVYNQFIIHHIFF